MCHTAIKKTDTVHVLVHTSKGDNTHYNTLNSRETNRSLKWETITTNLGVCSVISICYQQSSTKQQTSSDGITMQQNNTEKHDPKIHNEAMVNTMHCL